MKGKNIDGQLRAIHSKAWTPKFKWSQENISTVPKKSGVYEFYDHNGKLLYVGVSKKDDYGNLRHRIESYHEKDDYEVHPTKKMLRPKIAEFRYKTVPIRDAREIEHELKKHTPFNFL